MFHSVDEVGVIVENYTFFEVCFYCSYDISDRLLESFNLIIPKICLKGFYYFLLKVTLWFLVGNNIDPLIKPKQCGRVIELELAD